MTSASVVLIGPQFEENLSVGYLAAALAAGGHRPVVIRFDGPEDRPTVTERVSRAQPDLVGISIPCQHRAEDQAALAAGLRAAGCRAPIVLGGHFPTLAPAVALEHISAADGVLRGEAERSIVALADAVASGEVAPLVPGLVRRCADGSLLDAGPPAPIADLDALPFPLRSAPPARIAGLPLAPLLGSRGCHGSCTFCSIRAFHHASPGCPPLRLRSPQNLADEMARLQRDRGVGVFLFHDDIFFLPRSGDTLARFERLREELDRRGVGRIFSLVPGRPELIDPSVVPRLRDLLGIVGMYLGIESGSARTLHNLRRGVDRATVVRTLDTVRACRLQGSTNYLLFEPDARLDDVAESLALMRAYPEVPSNFARADAYAGTPLHQRLAADGRLGGTWSAPGYVIADPAVEAMYRICTQVFRDRAGPRDCLLNRAMSLGQQKEILRRSAAAAPAAGEAAMDAERLIAEVSLDTVAHLEVVLAYVASEGHTDPRATVRFIADRAGLVNAASVAFYERAARLESDIARLVHDRA